MARILFVDDNPNIFETIACLLKNSGFQQVRIALFAFIALFSVFIAPAYADVEVTLSVDKQAVSGNDYLQLEVSLSGKSASEPEIEGLENFEVLSQGSSQNISIIGMTITRRKTYSFTLRPIASSGTVKLRAKVKQGGMEYFSNVVKVELLKSPSRQNRPQARPFSQKTPGGGMFGGGNPFNRMPGSQEFRADDFLLQGRVSSQELYVGQELVYTLSFYRAVNIWSNVALSLPDTKRLWSVNIPESERKGAYAQTIGGRRYAVTELSLLLYPLAVGESAIGAGSARFKIDPFSSSLLLESEEIKLNVLPLPLKGKPENFTGLVGNFSIEAKPKQTFVKAGEPLTLTVTISGSGNLHSIPEPATPDFTGFEIYPPETKDDFRITPGGSGGARSFTYILVPEQAGQLTIGGFRSNFFDPAKGEYVNLVTKEIAIDVTGVGHSSAGIARQPVRREVERLSNGIRYIKPNVKILREEGRPYYKMAAFYIYIVSVLLLFSACVKWANRRRRLAGDREYARRKDARKHAQARLKKASDLLGGENNENFFGELDRALRRFMADKCGIPESSITREVIGEKLGGINGGSAEEFSRILVECDKVRFAPVKKEREEMEKLLDEAFRVVEEMEKKL